MRVTDLAGDGGDRKMDDKGLIVDKMDSKDQLTTPKKERFIPPLPKSSSK